MDSSTEQTTRLSTDTATPADGVPLDGSTTVPPSIGPAPEPAAASKFRLRRSRTNRMVAGVCGGLAESLGVDATVLRIGLVTLTVLGFGVGIVVYAAIWMLAPETDEP
jgi:phage shock protein C